MTRKIIYQHQVSAFFAYIWAAPLQAAMESTRSCHDNGQLIQDRNNDWTLLSEKQKGWRWCFWLQNLILKPSWSWIELGANNWWFQPIWKNMLVKLDQFPKNPGEYKKSLKPPVASIEPCWCYDSKAKYCFTCPRSTKWDCMQISHLVNFWLQYVP